MFKLQKLLLEKIIERVVVTDNAEISAINTPTETREKIKLNSLCFAMQINTR